MKAERKKPQTLFEPVLIVLETEEEAAAVYHSLSCAGTSSLITYCDKQIPPYGPLDYVYLESVKDKCWRALRNVYNPNNVGDPFCKGG
jgi:hypothetical protein